MFDMSITDLMTASSVAVASLTFVGSVVQNCIDRTQQTAAETREDLQEIIGESGRFLHPLTQEKPYPILYTAATITKEFRSRMGNSSTGKDVLAMLQDKDLLRSICVEGWIASAQIIHLMAMVEELERKASSHYLRGKLLLICQASFLLAGIVAKGCSPTYFYNTLHKLKPQICQDDEVEVVLNKITVELQNEICRIFNTKYKEPIILCLFFIQKACRSFMKLPDRKLVYLAKRPELILQDISDTDPNKMIIDPIRKIEQETSLPNRLEQVMDLLHCLKREIDPSEYQGLCDLIKLLKDACVIIC
jgi:hypothetical protein